MCWQIPRRLAGRGVEVDAGLPALLRDPQWQPYLVFPGEYVAAERVVSVVQPDTGKRPLFVLLDATWSEARKMFRKSPYLDSLPVLSLQAEQLSRYKLRRSKRDDHFCNRRSRRAVFGAGW